MRSDDGLIYQQPAPFHGKVWRHGEDMCSMGAGHSLVCDIACELERQKSRADTAARQAAWLRLVAWASQNRRIYWPLRDHPDPVRRKGECWVLVIVGGSEQRLSADLDADGLPKHNPTLEAALTAAMESVTSSPGSGGSWADADQHLKASREANDGCTICRGCLPPGEQCQACGRNEGARPPEPPSQPETALAKAIQQASPVIPTPLQRF